MKWVADSFLQEAKLAWLSVFSQHDPQVCLSVLHFYLFPTLQLRRQYDKFETNISDFWLFCFSISNFGN